MTPRPPRLCVVGSANVDLTFRTARLPRPGETLAGRAFHLGFGGKGANQAVAAARLGARVSFVARVGNDAFGADYCRRLAAEGLDTTHVRPIVGDSTGTAAILVDDAAENCIIVVPGANGRLTPQDILDSADAIRAADIVLCQLEVPLETTLETFRIARAAGVRTVLTPAPAVPLPDELLQLSDLLVPNQMEILTLAGPGATMADATMRLRARRQGTLVVTMGEHGALVLDSGGSTHVPAVKVTAVDTTGAGDAFTAALCVGWASGQPVREAAQYAVAVAALTVTRAGTQDAFPTRAEVDAFVEKPSGGKAAGDDDSAS